MTNDMKSRIDAEKSNNARASIWMSVGRIERDINELKDMLRNDEANWDVIRAIQDIVENAVLLATFAGKVWKN